MPAINRKLNEVRKDYIELCVQLCVRIGIYSTRNKKYC